MTDSEIRKRASIIMLPKCLEVVKEALIRGGKIEAETTVMQAVAKMAVTYADALVVELSKTQKHEGV